MLDEMQEELHTKIRKIVDDAIRDFLKGFPSDVRSNINKIAKKALGFSDSFSRWEVDHCNGRNSTISELITERSRQVAIQEVQKVKMTFTKTDTAAIVRDMKDRYRRELRNALAARIEEVAKERATKMVDILLLSNDASTEEDISNPDYGQKAIEELAMTVLLHRET